MEKKTYKKPISRIVVLDSEDLLRVNFGDYSLQQPIGVETGDFVGDMVPVDDDPNNQFSKGGSWEMEW